MRKTAYIFAAVMVVFYFAGTLLFLYALWRGYRLIKETKNRDEQ